MSTDKMPLYKTLHGKVVTTQNATQTKIPRGQKNITGKMSHSIIPYGQNDPRKNSNKQSRSGPAMGADK